MAIGKILVTMCNYYLTKSWFGIQLHCCISQFREMELACLTFMFVPKIPLQMDKN